MGDMTDKMSGKAKEMVGKATHNKRLQYKGKVEHEMADLRHKAKNVIDDVSKKMHD